MKSISERIDDIEALSAIDSALIDITSVQFENTISNPRNLEHIDEANKAVKDLLILLKNQLKRLKADVAKEGHGGSQSD